AILLITEGLFSMDSDMPDIKALQDVAREHKATLLVDVAHDFGSLGTHGGGALEIQNMLGKVDLVMGSFSKTFSSNGGFLATASLAVRQYMKFYGSPQTFSNALSPVQTAVIMQALKIVRSPEGTKLREQLNNNSVTLRTGLEKNGIRCIGEPSAIVPAYIGNEAVARIAWARAQNEGIHANLVEFPAVAVGSARFRMQLMPQHTQEQLDKTVSVITDVIAAATKDAAKISFPKVERAKFGTDPNTLTIASHALPALKEGDMKKLFAHARTATFDPGALLIREGSLPKGLFVIKKGTVTIEVDYLGQPLVLAECGPGEILGEMSLLGSQGASASVVASTSVETACLDKKELAELAKTDPELGTRFYQSLAMVLAGRLRHQNATVLPTLSHG
ncbi:MAG TPA: aminotransferase class I/II-fold pyridoxal phosphate-dependent enzyme, partial [bacterium]|nr:aminotransferase class I/II-fold pyridoxal phosphate-dependent enzyme [bacterium]